MAVPDAAVAIVRARTPEDSILLLRRTERDDDPWSGHWCLPGGRRDPVDPDLLQTALRELREECGIELGPGHPASALPLAPARQDAGRCVLVAPFVFEVDYQLATILDPREASDATWIPVSALLDPARHALRSVPGRPADVMYPCVALNGAPLWGFTYRLLTDSLGLRPRRPPAEQTGAGAAQRVLDYLLSQGLELQRGWEQRNVDGHQMITAAVRGKIPVGSVLRHFSNPGEILPGANALEVQAELVRLVGLVLDEYVIYAG